MQRRLIVNADDFGFTRDVNEGILACHRDGILTATTLMATGTAVRHAVELAKSTPTLDVGCHLVLVQGPDLPQDIPSLVQALAWNRIDPLAHFRKQLETILKAGIRPTHLDTHKHTHLIPQVLKAVLRVSEEYNIKWVRKPADFARDASAPRALQLTSATMRFALSGFDRKLTAANARRTDHFTGFQLTGRMTAQSLAATLHALPEGSTELMCHPGFLGQELLHANTRLKQSRVEEWRALCSPLVRSVLAKEKIQLTGYRAL